MKLSYYGYVFTEVKTGNKSRMPLKNFIKAFCQYDNPTYKNQFTHNGENVFLLSGVGNLYLFIQTRSNEVIKKINSADTSIGEIYDFLKTGEMIGFASYVYLMDSYLGFASTTMAPRIASFATFINDVLQSIGVDNYQFTLIPFLHQATKAEAMSMPFIGKSIIQINKENTFFDHLENIFGGTATEFEDVDSFEIIIKPKPRKNIEKAVKKMLSTVSDTGIDKMIIKAKDEDHSALIDLYLAGNGLLADNINTRDERIIAQTIQGKIGENEMLKQKVTEHEQDEAIPQISIEAITKFSNVDAWSTAISGVQSTD
jgi:Intracellular sensor of Lambda phage, Abi component